MPGRSMRETRERGAAFAEEKSAKPRPKGSAADVKEQKDPVTMDDFEDPPELGETAKSYRAVVSAFDQEPIGGAEATAAPKSASPMADGDRLRAMRESWSAGAESMSGGTRKVDGGGGYKYEMFSDGTIRVTGGPKNVNTIVSPARQGAAWAAIIGEIGTDGLDDPEGMKAKAAQLKKAPAKPAPKPNTGESELKPGEGTEPGESKLDPDEGKNKAGRPPVGSSY